MKLSVICFSMTGFCTAEKIKKRLKEQGEEISLFSKSRYLDGSIPESTAQWTGVHFTQDDGIIFVGACGIAVRSIAPYVAGKKSDPAILVVDECGKHVISLLSGHLGGANELTLRVSRILGADPVVTTATDLHSRFAVDVFAKKNNCDIYYMKAAKEVSAAILAGEPVGFFSEFPCKGELPEGLVLCDRFGNPSEGKKPEVGVAVTIYTSCMPFASTTQVVPRILTLGMGCRKNKESNAVITAAEQCLEREQMHVSSVEKLASITLKRDEAGLKALAEKWRIPFEVYEEEELKSLEGDFTPSSFVRTVTGVDNVCERSAVLGSANGKLISEKFGKDGVTTALAVRKWEVHFE